MCFQPKLPRLSLGILLALMLLSPSSVSMLKLPPRSWAISRIPAALSHPMFR